MWEEVPIDRTEQEDGCRQAGRQVGAGTLEQALLASLVLSLLTFELQCLEFRS